MNGSELYAMPAITAVGVDRTWKPWGTTCADLSALRTMPSSDRMNCHASDRITNDTKNGSSSRNRNVVLCRPPLKAIQYATGYPTSRVAIVTIAAYTSERMNCVWNIDSAVVYSPKCHVNR